jgi:hypothetical protein
MQLEFVLLADAVENVNGKLYVMGGGWTHFKAPSFPALLRLGIAVSVLVDWTECDEVHPLRIRLVGLGTRSPVEIDLDARISAGRPSDLVPGTSQRVFAAVNLNLPLPEPGKYRVQAAMTDVPEIVADFDALIPASVRHM